MVIYYVKSQYNPDKHPLIPNDFPWFTSYTQVENGIEIEEEDYRILESSFDLTEYNNSLKSIQMDIEEELEIKSSAYKGAGTFIADALERKVWARNTYLKSIGRELSDEQMNGLLTASMGIQAALKSGSLITARDGLNALKPAYPSYADIADWSLYAISLFV